MELNHFWRKRPGAARGKNNLGLSPIFIKHYTAKIFAAVPA